MEKVAPKLEKNCLKMCDPEEDDNESDYPKMNYSFDSKIQKLM